MDKSKIYDEERIRSENLQELFYKFEKDGTYSRHVGFEYLEPDELFFHDIWKMTREKIEKARKDVLDGKASPVVYYMEKNVMDLMTLSRFVGMPVWRVRRHFRPAVFRHLKPSVLQRYANAFDIPMDELTAIR